MNYLSQKCSFFLSFLCDLREGCQRWSQSVALFSPPFLFVPFMIYTVVLAANLSLILHVLRVIHSTHIYEGCKTTPAAISFLVPYITFLSKKIITADRSKIAFRFTLGFLCLVSCVHVYISCYLLC